MFIVGVYGPTKSGKTQLIESICRELSSDYRIGVLKNAPHHAVLDVPGKDSHRYAEAGAGASVVLGDGTVLMSIGNGLPADVALRMLQGIGDWDLVLVEGLTGLKIPMIKVGDGKEHEVPLPLGKIAQDGPEEKGTLLQHVDDDSTISFLKQKIDDSPARPCVELVVGDKKVPLSGFPEDVMKNTIAAIVSSLKGGEDGDIRLLVRRP